MEQAMTPLTGEIIGLATRAVRLPNVPCSKVKFKAVGTNANNVYLGPTSATLTLVGANNQQTGYELDANDETDWLPIDNLNKLYLICDTAGDSLVFIAFK